MLFKIYSIKKSTESILTRYVWLHLLAVSKAIPVNPKPKPKK